MAHAGCALFNVLHEDELSNSGSVTFICVNLIAELWNLNPLPHHWCDLSGTIHTDVQGRGTGEKRERITPISCLYSSLPFLIFVACRRKDLHIAVVGL
jgi:hypothetical protein